MSETIRTDELVETVLAGIADGVPLRQLCRIHGFSKSSWYRWMEEDAADESIASDDKLAGRFARARIDGFDAIAEETLEIADDGTNDWIERENKDGSTYTALDGEHVQRSKLRVETRLKLLAKWDPKRYGDRVDHTSSDGSMSPRPLADFYKGKPSDE